MCLGATLFPLGLQAGSYTNTFDDGFYDASADPQPEGAQLHGTAVIESPGGFAGGALKLTKTENSQVGSFVITDLDGGQPVNAFTATFKARIGGSIGAPADGWSFVFAPETDLGSAWGQEGTGTGLIVAFDTYNNTIQPDPPEDPPLPAEAPAITIRYGNEQIAEVMVPIEALITGDNGTPLWADVRIQLHADGSLDVVFDGVTYFSRLPLPILQAIEGVAYGFGAATGGLNANHFIDDLTLTTETGPVRAGLLHQPQSAAFMAGSTPRFYTLVTNRAPEVVFGYQWERQAPEGGTFVAVPGAIEPDFVGTAGVTAADNGAKYRLALEDQGGTTYSEEVTLTVINFTEPAYAYQENFTADPPQGDVYGTAAVDTGAGRLVLTAAANDQQGAFVIDDQNPGQAVSGITVAFDLSMSQTGADPDNVVVADGLSFNWAPDVEEAQTPAGGAAEDGSGSGLRVSFDVYDNTDGNPYNVPGEGPSVDLRWGSTVLGSVRVTPAELNTGADSIPVIVELTPEGLASVAVNGRFYFLDVPIPGWSARSLAKYAFYARTGGANQEHAISRVRIAPVVHTGDAAFVSQPAPALAPTGGTATFAVEPNYAVPPATIVWQRKGTGEADFADIAGATATTHTTPALTPADDGALYRAVVRLAPDKEAASAEALLTVVDFTHSAPQVALAFNGSLANTGSASGVVPAATTHGLQDGAERELVIETSGGPDDSGYLVLTDAANGQAGVVAVAPYTAAAQGALVATFDVNFATGGSPADGFSFNWGADVPTTVGGGDAEEGVGSGLSVTFDVYGADAPAIGVKYQGAFISDLRVPAGIRPPDWARVGIHVSNDGKVDVALNGVVHHHQLQLPGWTGIANGVFSVYARTGGLNENHWIDNLEISTSNYAGPLAITRQPVDAAVFAGQNATFVVETNDPAQATWVWESAPAGSDVFAPLAGATAASYTVTAATLADHGRRFRAVATGVSTSSTSDIVRLAVVDPTLPDPDATLDFDQATSLSYVVNGAAFEDDAGGVDDSRVAKLTIEEANQTGALLVDDFNDGVPIGSIIARFDVAVGKELEGAPADGFSFAWAPEVHTGTGPFGEEGTGNGLVVSFDTYLNENDNTGIAVRWLGETVAEVVMAPAELTFFPDYVRVVVKVDADGTVDVWYGDRVIFHDLPVTGFTPLAGAGFGWGARTGGANENVWIDNIRLTASPVAPPAGGIEIRRVGGNIEVTFDGVLQESTDLIDWADLTGQASPYTFPLPTSGARFFRVK